MCSLQNFAFGEKLVRVVNRAGEPWFLGVDVCRAIELAKPENALGELDADERDTLTEGVISAQTDDAAYVIISEPGVYRLVFRSRKPAAERFKRWLAHEVLPALRKTGRYGAEGAPGVTGAIASAREFAEAPLLHRLYLLDRVTRLYGRAVGRVMYRQLGLPPVPPPPPSLLDEARVCLRHLLDGPSTREGASWGQLIEEALEGGQEARVLLLAVGIKVCEDADPEGFVVANAHPRLSEMYGGTAWARGRWQRVLRRLPGAAARGPTRMAGLQVRGTFVPADLLDLDRVPALALC